MTGEAKLQSECIKWFRLQYPKYASLIFAIPNGGSRNILEAYNLKRQGVVAGVPDMMLATPSNGYHGMFVEMKTSTGKATSKQRQMLTALSEQGYCTTMCHSFNEFKAAIEEYLT